MNEPKIIKIKARKWEFWKPLEKVVVICYHEWEKVDEERLTYDI